MTIRKPEQTRCTSCINPLKQCEARNVANNAKDTYVCIKCGLLYFDKFIYNA